MQKTISLFLFLLISLQSWSTGQKEDPATTTVFTDSYERQVNIPTEINRIVSLAPSITEIIYALGSQDKLKGRTDYCDYPEDALRIPSMGSLRNPSMESIIQAQPDLVIASTHFQKDTLKALEDLNIPILILKGEDSIEGTYWVIRQIGTLLHKQEKSEQIITQMKKTIDQAAGRINNSYKPKVYYVVAYGQQGDFTAGGNTFIGQLIQEAGGINIAQDLDGWAYSFEKIVEQDPDIIICSQYYNVKEGLSNTEGYKDLRAIKEGRIYTIDSNILDRQGPRLAQAFVDLVTIIHPESFE
ncbi:ABC transporter substrate-binding protein [Spirochaeta cellobiosiphila]|uniref:ABC transporter substrate-binding protein n=1 Tax=Spirochaeta cellobiosiphila TaxID=504483 RepID=UPI0003F80F48|nr:ABC transporter substrate-binding protein [Spirochaeta cellobiosiphila]